jgi:hypothetical protein
MPDFLLGSRHVSTRRITLEQHEAAHVLQVPVSEVRNMLRRQAGAHLSPVRSGSRRNVAIDEVAELVEEDPLAIEVLVAILERRLRVARPATEDTLPTSLVMSVRAL